MPRVSNQRRWRQSPGGQLLAKYSKFLSCTSSCRVKWYVVPDFSGTLGKTSLFKTAVAV